ncbi:MAG: chemotaxis protein CheW [Desulfobacteraceae bacterium]|nr:MAG: chemotaxis protein CheW [Desulfobacteraceae bacterium]
MNETAAISKENLPGAEDAIQMVGFVLAGELFGVDILMVQEIIKESAITSIPDSPDFIEGVINLRGNIIPIIDLRKRLNLPAATKAPDSPSWTLILDIGGRTTGFIVDHVTRVIKMPQNAIQPPPEMVVSALKSQYINGICRLDEQMMAVLDFNRILAVDEFKRLGALKRQQAR